MSDVEHTPGPWELDEIDPSGLMKPIFVESGDATICAMSAFLEPNPHVDPKEAMANARLIAAAPDLLSAAKEALDALNKDEGIPSKASDKLAHAIQKAEGAEQ